MTTPVPSEDHTDNPAPDQNPTDAEWAGKIKLAEKFLDYCKNEYDRTYNRLSFFETSARQNVTYTLASITFIFLIAKPSFPNWSSPIMDEIRFFIFIVLVMMIAVIIYFNFEMFKEREYDGQDMDWLRESSEFIHQADYTFKNHCTMLESMKVVYIKMITSIKVRADEKAAILKKQNTALHWYIGIGALFFLLSVVPDGSGSKNCSTLNADVSICFNQKVPASAPAAPAAKGQNPLPAGSLPSLPGQKGANTQPGTTKAQPVTPQKP